MQEDGNKLTSPVLSKLLRDWARRSVLNRKHSYARSGESLADSLMPAIARSSTLPIRTKPIAARALRAVALGTLVN